MLTSEIIIAVCALAQGLALILSRGEKSKKAIEWMSLLGFGFAALSLVLTANRESVNVFFAMLEDQPLFRLPRAGLFLAGLLLSRTIVSTKELPSGRKPEVLFLLSLLALICDLLVLSRQVTLSYILLVAGSWLGLFLGGLAFRGRTEGEAVLKQWLQASLSMAIGFGSLVVLALISGGVHFDTIAQYVRSQAEFSPQTLTVVLALLLPFLMAGGLFPFHFVYIDRDQGMPWSVQALLVVIFQGAVSLAAWKMGIEVFGLGKSGNISDGMRTLQFCGLIGGFWLAIFALAQENSKRLFSSMIGAQWSAVLVAGALPSALSMASVAYAFAAAFIWSGVLAFVWSRFQEFSRGDLLKDVYGLGREFRASGLILLLALASPLCVPGFPGFPTMLHLLAGMIEQRSLFLLSAEVLLLAVVCFLSIRVGTDLLFRRAEPSVGSSEEKKNSAAIRYGALDWAVILTLALALLALGFLWHRVLASLSESAKVFLN